MKTFLNGKNILVTGGTGSFGNSFIKRIITDYSDVGRLVIFSRDELKQYQMMEELNKIKKSKINFVRFFLGDVRDKDRLKTAFNNIDIVVHAAALKQVPAAEYNPFEFIKTNIIGAENIIEAALESNIKNVIALSTDKAVAPINLYGATKLCSDKLFTAANNIIGAKDIKFSVVRYGNVMNSRGSVFPIFYKNRFKEYLPITDEKMSRFNINLPEAVNLVIWSIKNNFGGEVFVPKISSYKIVDLAKAVSPKCKFKIIGIRPGEKIHEELISSAESINTFDLNYCYSVISQGNEKLSNFYKKKKFKKVAENFTYNSGSNKKVLKILDLKNIIKSEKISNSL